MDEKRLVRVTDRPSHPGAPASWALRGAVPVVLMALLAPAGAWAQSGFRGYEERSWWNQLVHGLQWFVDPGANNAALSTDSLMMLIVVWSTLWFVLLMGIMLWWTFRWRRRPGVPAPPSPSHNLSLEILWTVVPSASLVVIFFLGFTGYMDKRMVGENAIRMDLSAWKWGWALTYPNGATSGWTRLLTDTPDGQSPREYPIFVFPAGRNIQLQMSSQDVIHSFWVPALRMKRDVMPNRYTSFTFQVPELGDDSLTGYFDPEDRTSGTYAYQDYWIFCAEYCGQDHSEMAAIMRVVSGSDYEKIIGEVWGDQPLDRQGQLIYTTQCSSCHSLDGSSVVGPTWKNLWGNPVPLVTGETILRDADNVAWANYMREAIYEPGAKKRAGYGNQVMQSFQGALDEDELRAVLVFMALQSDTPLALEYASAAMGEGDEPAPEGGTDDASVSPDAVQAGGPMPEGDTGSAGDPPGGERTPAPGGSGAPAVGAAGVGDAGGAPAGEGSER